jgi:hypothetical protein
MMFTLVVNYNQAKARISRTQIPLPLNLIRKGIRGPNYRKCTITGGGSRRLVNYTCSSGRLQTFYMEVALNPDQSARPIIL